LFEK
jgi:transposase InsO family protein